MEQKKKKKVKVCGERVNPHSCQGTHRTHTEMDKSLRAGLAHSRRSKTVLLYKGGHKVMESLERTL